MPQPDGKQQATPSGGRDERLPSAWQRLLDGPRASSGDEPGVLGFFLEVVPEEGAASAHLEVAPLLLAVIEHGRYARPVPLDSRVLVQTPLPPHEQRLAATVLGLPQSVRKSRSYARLSGHVGDSLLIELLDTAPCFLGGLAVGDDRHVLGRQLREAPVLLPAGLPLTGPCVKPRSTVARRVGSGLRGDVSRE